jgi:hypothetical protein
MIRSAALVLLLCGCATPPLLGTSRWRGGSVARLLGDCLSAAQSTWTPLSAAA